MFEGQKCCILCSVLGINNVTHLIPTCSVFFQSAFIAGPKIADGLAISTEKILLLAKMPDKVDFFLQKKASERDRVFRNGKADRSLVKHPKISIVKRRYRCNGIKIAPKSEAHRFRGFRWNFVTNFFGTGWPVARILVKRN